MKKAEGVQIFNKKTSQYIIEVNELNMEEEIEKIELPDGKTGELIIKPLPLVFNLPFIKHAIAEAIIVNSDGIIITCKFSTPQKIDLEYFFIPGHLRLSGEMLVDIINLNIEENYINIHLAQPIEVITRALGNIPLKSLGVETSGKVVRFGLAEEWLW